MSGNKGRGKGYQWLRDHADYPGDACLIWPFSRDKTDGYGRTGYNGELFLAHRLMCILVHGEPPTKKHEAGHSCGKGHLGCCNPRHLSWKTRGENELDKRIHGTGGLSKGSRTKLTPDQIADIRRSKGVVTIKELARKYGIKRGAVDYWINTNHPPAPPGTSTASLWRRKHNISRAKHAAGR